MKRLLLFIFLLTYAWGLSATIQPYSRTKKDTAQKTRILSVGAGFVKTSLNFLKNAHEDTYSNGYSLRVGFQTSETFRMAFCYSKAESVNIDPTWVNVNNSFFDLDAHFMMHFMDKRNIAYFILGLSGQSWRGYYTGMHDLNGWKLHATPNSMYSAFYYGAKLGMGAEVKIAGPISGYGEFMFRVTKTDVGTGLTDVVYGLGIKMNLANLGHSKSSKKRHSFLHFRDKYHWF